MKANQLGNRYYSEYLKLNRTGPYCPPPFIRIPVSNTPPKFLKTLIGYDEMLSIYDEQGYTVDDLKEDYYDSENFCRIYMNKDMMIGVYYKTVLIYDGKKYIKTDNFNQPDSWYYEV